MTNKTAKLTHEDVLSAQDALIWRTVRTARSFDSVSGNREATIDRAVKMLDLTPEFIAGRLHESAKTLRQAGVIATMLHWVERRSMSWLMQSAPEGSRRARDGQAAPTAMFFPSERFAYNAKIALDLIDMFDEPSRVAIADVIDTALETNPATFQGATTLILESVTNTEGVSPTIGRFTDSVGVHVPGGGNRAWIGKDSYARWMSATLRAGVVTPPATLNNND